MSRFPSLALALAIVACAEPSPEALPFQEAPPVGGNTGPSWVCHGEPLQMNSPNGNLAQMYRLDLDVMPFSFTAVGGQAPVYNGIGFNRNDGYVYGMIANTFHIVRVHADGTTYDLGRPDNLANFGNTNYAGDVLPDGRYVVTPQGGALATIDLSVSPPHVTSTVLRRYADGRPGTPQFADIALAPDGSAFYGYDSASSRWARINPTTGAVTLFGAAQAGLGGASLFFDEAGRLYLYGPPNAGPGYRLYQIDLVNGTATALSTGPAPVGQLDGTFCARTRGVDATISIDALIDACGGLTVTLVDADLNLGAMFVDAIEVPVTNLATGEVESVLLHETGPDTGIFVGSLPTSGDAADSADQSGTLTAQPGQTFQVTYEDALTTTGVAAIRAASGQINPADAEVCDGADNDCDGQVDEGFDTNGNGIGDCVEACVTDLGDAAWFNVFAEDDYIGGTDVGGKAAAGDLLDMRGFSLAAANPGPVAAVAGRLSLRHGRVYGDAWWDTARSVSFVTFVGGSQRHGGPVDFVGTFADLDLLAVQLHSAAATGSATVDAWGNVTATGTDAVSNHIPVDASLLVGATSFTVHVPAGSSVVLDVTGTAPALRSFGVFLDGTDAAHTLWSFPDATTLDLYGIGLPGTVLAPHADVSFTNGALDGQLIAHRVVGNGEPHWVPFNGAIPCH